MLANKRYYLYMCLGIVAYSGLIELGQSYIPGREMSAFDLLANIVGVALGALVVYRRR
jgi:VanZ family protein